MAQQNGHQPLIGGPINERDSHSQTWDAMESYFECITTCSLDDGDCVTQCVEQLREHG